MKRKKNKKGNTKPYFSEAKEGDLIFGLVYGKGKVINVYSKDDPYHLEVEYDNGASIHYTIDAYPNWGNFDTQTIFYQEDINLFDLDMSPVKKILSIKEIIKLRNKKKLEIRNESGIWRDYNDSPIDYRETMLESQNFHLFRHNSKKRVGKN